MYPRALPSPKDHSLAVPSMLFLYMPQSLDNIAAAEGTYKWHERSVACVLLYALCHPSSFP